MLFILFDVEIVFVYPWAVLVRELGPAGIGEMFTFLTLLAIGYVYIVKRRAFEWE
jgi:NADH-quinone oxidoreductase subunit A